ncbi:MAG: glycerol-3-phosphate 1-O-acyltransferase PlsY [Ndongobacter sp.]|nr:glycerol-3-phosphate 1-O-acyltransferase PlsY [Ndongobacter sp.]
MIGRILILALLSYLLGGIPFGFLLGKLFCQVDIRSMGSGNSGATNALRILGPAIGVSTLVLDGLKGYVSACLGTVFAGSDGMLAAGLFCVIGHCYSPYMRLRGGKGVATSLGVLLCISPLLVGCLVILFFLLVLPTRLVSLGSVFSAVAAPFLSFFLFGWQHETAVILCMGLLVLWRHRANIRRLLRGEESRITFRKKR